MQQILHAINNLAASPLEQRETIVTARSEVSLSAINPSDLSLRVEQGAVVDLVLLHGDDASSSIVVSLERDAVLNLTQLFVGRAPIDVEINQSEGSISKCIAVSLSHNSVLYDVKLSGKNAHSELTTLQMGAERDNNALEIKMEHLSSDCSSDSLSKCVASGESSLRFEGLVYVAQDAQRTAAEQNCRSIELSDSSHIVAQPQLEIYADDVKCSHGATMGQVDTDAILYMRQRGLSEAQARRLQIEGFLNDVVERCSQQSLREALKEVINEKLQQM